MRITAIIFTLVLQLSAAGAQNAAVWIGMSAAKYEEREGIYRATLDLDTGKLSRPELAAAIKDPGFLALNPEGTRLYAVCKLANGDGGVAAFEVSADKQSLKLLNTEPTGGGDACHVATDRAGRLLFTAQYGGGGVSAFPLAPDGRLRPHSDVIQHSGTGPNKVRQEGPHPHWVGTDKANRFLCVPDLGTDRVVVYEVDSKTGKLKPHGHGDCPAGSGPRHLVFHPNGRFAYVINELAITVTAFRYDPTTGKLSETQTIDSLPESERKVAANSGSEIYIHPSGEFLYAATRGDDTISVFRVDSGTGKLTFVEREHVRGSHPRCFNLDPTGRWLLAAGRDSNTVSVFKIDPQNGKLIYNQQVVNSPSPICVEMQLAP
jgi:6-phosphogluconolactonase